MEAIKEVTAAVKTFGEQLVKDADKLPGWVPLLIMMYLVVPQLPHYAPLTLAGWQLKLSDETLAPLFTLILYHSGDALDKVCFKKRDKEGKLVRRFDEPGWLQTARSNVQHALHMTDGVYAVSLSLAVTSEERRSMRFIHFFNETAKFLRSLALPALIFGIFCFAWRHPCLGVVAVLAAILFLPCYYLFKLWHMQRLYELACELVKNTEKYSAQDLEGQDLKGMRLFFWDGVFVGSARTSGHAPG